MTALPEHPTERDRERFRDLTKAMGYPLEYARCGQHEAYSEAITHMVFEVWWKAERERQLLQNLNQSQGVKLTEWENKYAVLANEYQSTCAAANDTLERLEKAESELEAERKRLDWALEHAAWHDEDDGRLKYGAGFLNYCPKIEDNPRATIDELIAGEQK